MFNGVIKNIFFDFDGVILDSVDCKTKAFEGMYSKYGQEIADKVKRYHLENGGVSRFEKFKYWHQKHLGIKITKKQLRFLCDEFSDLVVNKVISSKEIDGSIDFIKKNHKNYKFWIITGTPTNEIEQIADKIGIAQYFLGIHGSPENKQYWISKILKNFKLNSYETLFLGDALTDYDAAKHCKLNFALREAQYNKIFFEGIELSRFTNYEELQKTLNE
jgi:phosphoglycolate phosphatase-like HAD superfamily hydrolase